MSEKRKIILKEFEPEKFDGDTPEDIEVRRTAPQTFWFNGSVTTTPGVALEVPEKTARIAIESGKFEYAPETVEEIQAEIAETKGELPADFPAVDLLKEEGFLTYEDVQTATDETLLAINGIGDKTLKAIREKEGEK